MKLDSDAASVHDVCSHRLSLGKAVAHINKKGVVSDIPRRQSRDSCLDAVDEAVGLTPNRLGSNRRNLGQHLLLGLRPTEVSEEPASEGTEELLNHALFMYHSPIQKRKLNLYQETMNNKVQFSVECKGETSDRNFSGLFTAKTKLSHREVLKEDEVRRNVLGQNPQYAGEYAASVASAIAYLAVRLVDSPDWWKQSGGGLELEDENVLVEVNNAAVKAIKEEQDARVKAAEAAQGALKAKVTELNGG